MSNSEGSPSGLEHLDFNIQVWNVVILIHQYRINVLVLPFSFFVEHSIL